RRTVPWQRCPRPRCSPPPAPRRPSPDRQRPALVAEMIERASRTFLPVDRVSPRPLMAVILTRTVQLTITCGLTQPALLPDTGYGGGMSETSVAVTVRYFAAARAASGVDEEVLTLAEPATVGTAMEAAVAHHGADLERVLTRCSFLLNTVAVRD